MQDKTCFEHCRESNYSCSNSACRCWIENHNVKNCIMLSIKKDGMTFHEIGALLKLSRMRILQIERDAITKIRSKL